jgi:hypothetical protein
MSVADPGKKKIIAAGKALSRGTLTTLGDILAAKVIVQNWRIRHVVPMGIIEADLRDKCAMVDSRAFTSGRLKRMDSIIGKLSRKDALPGLTLWSMQDIGGCRAVLPTLAGVRAVDTLYANSGSNLFVPIRRKDYISEPKKSGYRDIHRILKFQGKSPPGFDGMQIEIQLRSRQQHIFATAVETVGYFTEQALKSSLGQERWLRFFSLIGSLLSLNEGGPVVPGTPESRSELLAELKPRALALHIELLAFGGAVKHTESFQSHERSDYYVLVLHATDRSWEIHGFKREDLELANMLCIQSELDGFNAVLVSTETLASLWEAYPNYFLDLNAFMRIVGDVIHER